MGNSESSGNRSQSANPRIVSCTPAFGINSAANAMDHYVKRLGFTLDFEWRESPQQPTLLQVSRDNLTLFLNEADQVRGDSLRVYATHLNAMVEEWNLRSDNALQVVLEPPYNLPTVYVADADGNYLIFQEMATEQSEAQDEIVYEKMRQYVKNQLAQGQALPNAAQLQAQVGGTLGHASEVLLEFE